MHDTGDMHPAKLVTLAATFSVLHRLKHAETTDQNGSETQHILLNSNLVRSPSPQPCLKLYQSSWLASFSWSIIVIHLKLITV